MNEINMHPMKKYRTQRGLSQAALANLIGVSQGIVWRWEKWMDGITAERAVSIEEKVGSDLPAETLSATIRKYEIIKSKREMVKKQPGETGLPAPCRDGDGASQTI